MAKSKKANAIQRVIIIGSVLIALQIVYIYVFSGTDEPLNVRDAINKQIEASSGTSQEKDKKKILAALYDFRGKNGGKFPQSLTELTPAYFDRIPIDPDTGQPYKYTLENNNPFIGDKNVVMASKSEIQSAQDALITSLTDDATLASYVYDASGKRDPFRPFNFAPKVTEANGKTPLEKYSIGQLKLTAILGAGDDASAMVENAVGKGFTIKKGMKIGNNDGEVIEIQPDKILILEKTVDFTGQTKTRTIEMRLRTKEQEAAGAEKED
jgi:Tfp pilus assembly protein PilP